LDGLTCSVFTGNRWDEIVSYDGKPTSRYGAKNLWKREKRQKMETEFKEKEERYNQQLKDLDLENATYQGKDLDSLARIKNRNLLDPRIMEEWERADKRMRAKRGREQLKNLDYQYATYNGYSLDYWQNDGREKEMEPEVLERLKSAERDKKKA